MKQQIKQLLKNGNTMDEVAAHFKISTRTLYRTMGRLKIPKVGRVGRSGRKPKIK